MGKLSYNYSSCKGLDIPVAFDGHGVRDKPLSFHWQAPSADWLRTFGFPVPTKKKRRMALEAIILDVMVEARGLNRWISYSRRAAFYSGKQRYYGTAYTWRNVIPTVDLLAEKGLVENHVALPGSRGWQSRLRASSELLSISRLPLVTLTPGDPIRLKDNFKHLCDYRDTEQTVRMRRFLEEMNEAICSVASDIDAPGMHRDGSLIRFDDHAICLAMDHVFRVFNNGRWSHGGRFYGGWWQGVKKIDRPHITIDGVPTVELDHDQLHPRLLYRIAEKDLDGDAYTLRGFERDMGKRAFNILLNAPSYPSALGALANEIGGIGAYEKAAQLIEAMRERHDPVAKHFHSGIGLKLQNIDAEMAERVMKRHLRKGIVCLPIHDSFIVQQRHQGTLQESMDEAFHAAA